LDNSSCFAQSSSGPLRKAKARSGRARCERTSWQSAQPPLRDGTAGVPVNVAGMERPNSETKRTREWREIRLGTQILRDLGISSIRLRTPRPMTYVGLSGFGIEISPTEGLE
jgi:hypothetical protein